MVGPSLPSWRVGTLGDVDMVSGVSQGLDVVALNPTKRVVTEEE